MAFTTPDFATIRDAILRDISNQVPGAAVGVDSDHGVRAAGMAAAIEGLYQYQAWIARQILPDTADPDWLERHAGLHGMTRLAATRATGTVTFSGSAGSAIAVGVEVKTLGGVAYVTTASGTIGSGGTLTLAAQASVTGLAGNAVAGAAVTLTSAPAGVQSSATAGAMTGGTDVESDAALLARLLYLLRNPPMGGAAHDYVRWAMSVAGVTSATCFSGRRGPGTVDVAVMTAGGPASGSLVAAVHAYIDTVRPVTADCLVVAPTAVPVAVTATLVLAAGYTITDVAQRLNAAVAAYFAALGPGDPVVRSKLQAIISIAAGVADFTLAAPGANVVPLVDASHLQIATQGTVSWSV